MVASIPRMNERDAGCDELRRARRLGLGARLRVTVRRLAAVVVCAAPLLVLPLLAVDGADASVSRGVGPGGAGAAPAVDNHARRLESVIEPAGLRLRNDDLLGLAVGDVLPARDLFAFGKPDGEAGNKERVEPPFVFLPGEDPTVSVPVGTVTDGYLVNARELRPDGAAHAILPRQRARGLRYGTDAMVELIEDAAMRVAARHPGATLQVGNIGRHGGGDIPYSVSHNSGRDADLGFYARDPFGEPALLPDLTSFTDSGVSRGYGGYYRFDVPRNWALIEALIESPVAEIQYLFISNGLKRLLLEHARASGASARTIQRAESLLRQPGREIPHDDHLHVRLFCSSDDLSRGCAHTGALHSWAPSPSEGRARGVALARTMLAASEPGARAAAAHRLVLLDDRGAVPELLRLLDDPSADVRAAAAVASAALGGGAVVARLVERYGAEPDAAVQRAIVRAVGAIPDSRAARFLASVMQEPQPVSAAGKTWDLRLDAVDAAREQLHSASVPGLIALLQSDDAELRARAAASLEVIANRSVHGLDLRASAVDPDELARAAAAWQGWHTRAQRMRERADWVNEGFEQAGYTLPRAARDRAAVLARAAGDDRPWIRVNAQLMLMQMTGNQPRSLEWHPDDAQLYWTRWVRRNPGRIASR